MKHTTVGILFYLLAGLPTVVSGTEGRARGDPFITCGGTLDMKIGLGHEVGENGKPDLSRSVVIPEPAFPTHLHLLGGTGKGKTTAIQTLLQQLLLHPTERACWVIVDRMGGLSADLLRFLASDFCPQHVRNRLVYFEPARMKDVGRIMGFNPLLYGDDIGLGFYKTQRGADIILRGHANQNLSEMPRLARWLFNSLWAVAQLGLTVSDAVHLLMPGSPYHRALLQCLPPGLQAEWNEIQQAHGSEASRILESTRNRLKPYFESDILNRMFGSARSHLDAGRMTDEGRIFLLNLNSLNRLSGQEADAIGGLVINEFLTCARGREPWNRKPVYLLLDEFQRFVGKDLDEALPEVRQLKVRLILAHQFLSQLKRGDHDLTMTIFQAQTRLVFGMQGPDATMIAEELASVDFDPYRVKDELYAVRQRKVGDEIIELSSWGDSRSDAENWTKSVGSGWSAQESRKRTQNVFGQDQLGSGRGQTGSESQGTGGGTTHSQSHARTQHLVAKMEDFEELVQRTYFQFEEMKQIWAGQVRKLRTGECVLRLVDDERLRRVMVQRSVPGHLAWSPEEVRRFLPQAEESLLTMLETNYASDFFASPAEIDRERELRLQAVLHPRIELRSDASGVVTDGDENPLA